MFYLRLNRIKIFNNREGLFFKKLRWDNAEVSILSFVNTDKGSDFPDLSELQRTTDLKKQKEIINAATEYVTQSLVLRRIDKIKDFHEFTFGDTGVSVYSSKEIPNEIQWLLYLIESDEDVRDRGKLIEKVVGHKDYDNVVMQIGTLFGLAVNPVFTASAMIAKFVLQILGEELQKNKDDLIGYSVQSLFREPDFPHGIRNKNDVKDLTGNMFYDYSIFGVENDK